jgi:hypothetical protein
MITGVISVASNKIQWGQLQCARVVPSVRRTQQKGSFQTGKDIILVNGELAKIGNWVLSYLPIAAADDSTTSPTQPHYAHHVACIHEIVQDYHCSEDPQCLLRVFTVCEADLFYQLPRLRFARWTLVPFQVSCLNTFYARFMYLYVFRNLSALSMCSIIVL